MINNIDNTNVTTPLPREGKGGGVAYEIMAPVGSPESLAAALRAGADSIYFGIERLNMRAHSASTFTIAEMQPMFDEVKDSEHY